MVVCHRIIASLLTVMVCICAQGCERQSPAARTNPKGSEARKSSSGPLGGELVLYCGRSKVLIEPLVERFRKESGVQVKVRYGTDSEVLATLGEEGDRSPADMFWANTTG